MKQLAWLLVSTALWAAEPTQRLSKEQKIALYAEQVASLSNLAVVQRPLFLCFSAAPGMGITEVAKEVEKRLAGIRLSSNETRDVLKNHGYYEVAGEFRLHNYFEYLLLRLIVAAKNGFFIFDKSIDRSYERLERFAQIMGFSFFVVRLDLSRELFEQRVGEKYVDLTPERRARLVERWYGDYSAFPTSYVDFTIDVSTKERAAEGIALLVTKLQASLMPMHSYVGVATDFMGRMRRVLFAYAALTLFH